MSEIHADLAKNYEDLVASGAVAGWEQLADEFEARPDASDVAAFARRRANESAADRKSAPKQRRAPEAEKG